MDLKSTILQHLRDLFEEEELEAPEIVDTTVLLETDLDSLGFAVLVTRLESELGYDPFSLADEPLYPVTFADFVEVYERFADVAT